ncbi:MAG: hypothetical protein ACJ74U_13200 [Jatrophihabitantaceae bacterium]
MADEDFDSESETELEQSESELHERFIAIVLAEVERERFPSSQLLDLLESRMSRRDRVRIANLLLDNLAAHRYPSPAMLRRVARLVG